MTLQNASKIGIKILAAGLFVALAVFNIQVVVPANNTGSALDLASVKLEAFMPSATAENPSCGLIYCFLPSGYSTTGCARNMRTACGMSSDCGC